MIHTKKIAVVLSGCGVKDGSEIHEAVATLLALARAGVHYQCVAPNHPQTQVVNHLTGAIEKGQTRSMLVEAARIARGDIKDINELDVNTLDAAVYPGGMGAATNLCDFSTKGPDHQVQADVLRFAQAMKKIGKPQGFICIAPALIAKIYGPGVKMTIGKDAKTAAVMNTMGNVHQEANATDVVVDEPHKVVSTPAYMMASSITEVFEGVEKLVQRLITMI